MTFRQPLILTAVTMSSGDRVTYARATWLFLRLLGLVYLIAFWSAGTQILGLVGHNGILPADQYMKALSAIQGVNRFWIFPTLTWISASDASLRTLCIGGVILSLLLMVGVLPPLVLPLLWLFYLSLSVVCQEFLSFQWDTLLLETGFLAIFLAPLVLRERRRELDDPPHVVVWLFLWLLFRLMVGSGVVKLASGDPSWHNLTALSPGTLIDRRCGCSRSRLPWCLPLKSGCRT
jgi:hypothetical protein